MIIIITYSVRMLEDEIRRFVTSGHEMTRWGLEKDKKHGQLVTGRLLELYTVDGVPYTLCSQLIPTVSIPCLMTRMMREEIGGNMPKRGSRASKSVDLYSENVLQMDQQKIQVAN